MKNFLAILVALSLAGGAVMAQDMGLTAGVELGFTTTEDLMNNAYIMPSITYENNDDLLPGLDLSAKLAIPFWIKPVFWMNTNIELKAGYNLYLAPDSRLTPVLKINAGIPVTPSGQYASVSLAPGVRFTQSMDFGNIYAQLDLPFNLLPSPAFNTIGLDITLGYAGNGIGAGLTIYNYVKPGNSLFQFVKLFGSYDAYPLYVGLDIKIPTMEKGVELLGITVSPEVRYWVMPELQAYLGLDIGNIAAKYGDIGIGLRLGAKYSL